MHTMSKTCILAYFELSSPCYLGFCRPSLQEKHHETRPIHLGDAPLPRRPFETVLRPTRQPAAVPVGQLFCPAAGAAGPSVRQAGCPYA